jgi:pimeloyl-ACP methyl ester carboxylesterase
MASQPTATGVPNGGLALSWIVTFRANWSWSLAPAGGSRAGGRQSAELNPRTARNLPGRAAIEDVRGEAVAVLIAAPFVGDGGWLSDEFELTSELGAGLPLGVPVHVFHGLQDQTAPPSHAGLHALAIPQAQVHQLPGRDHQLNNDLSEVAEAIRISRPGPVTDTQSQHHFHASS